MKETIAGVLIIILFLMIIHYRVLAVKRLRTHKDNIEQQMHIMQSLTEIYLSAHIINLQYDSFYEINSRSHIRDIVGKEGNAQETMKLAMSQLASDEYKTAVLDFVNFETLNERIKDMKTISMEFFGTRSGWCRALFIVINRDSQGNIEDVVFAVQKIDEEKTRELEYQKQLKLAAEEAQRANCAKTEFLSRMSHDIRTPINGIIGMLNILEKSEGDIEKSRECREKISISSKHLLSLINDVLDMSKLESGETEFIEEPFNLKELLLNCRQIVEPLAEECSVHLMEFDQSELKDSNLIGCPLHVRQIIVNIISNAIKYNKYDGKVGVRVATEKKEDNTVLCCFTISDTGIGMSKSFQQHLFEPFMQEHPDARTTYKGTGLGLAIVKEMVEAMNGSIKVESEENVGSTFTVWLPFGINSDSNALKNDIDLSEQVSIEGVKVLLVEDNDFNMEVAQFMLEDLGAIVTTAENGQAAFDMFTSNPPGTFDVILMDVMMPVMDGLSATKHIREYDREDAKSIPIFAMTANAFAEDAKACYEAGMNEHLVKPLDIEKLRHTIKHYCR